MIGNFKINLSTLLILALIILLILQRECQSPPSPVNPTVITKVETKWDTLKIDRLVYVPKWKTKTKTIHDTIPSDIDTLSILKDYYAKYFYTDTLDLDTLGNIVVNDTVSRNTIVSRRIKPNIFIPTTTVHSNTTTNKTRLYTGINISANKQSLSQAGVNLMLKTKKSKMYGVGIGFNRDLQPVLSGSLYWELKLKKPKVNQKLF